MAATDADLQTASRVLVLRWLEISNLKSSSSQEVYRLNATLRVAAERYAQCGENNSAIYI